MIEFGTSVARHVAIWPFGTQTQRLLLLVDPEPTEPSLLRALLRAMQDAYERAETDSQVSAVRQALLAAHDVLRSHNRGAPDEARVAARAVVAAARGPTAYVGLVGHAAAFSWSGAVLEGQHTATRPIRPLGLEADPRVTLWSAPFGPGDRLVLACGAGWNDETFDLVRDVLRSTPTELAAARLADALAGARGTCRVLVADGAPGPARRDSAPRYPAPRRQRLALPARAVVGLLLAVVAFVSLGPAQPLLQSRRVSDPGGRTDWVAPRRLVSLGNQVSNVVDLAVSRDAVYTLDVAEGAVRGFELSADDQLPTPDTLVLGRGTPVGGRRLDAPVAIEYVQGGGASGLVVVDRARGVVQVQRGTTTLRPLASSRGWQRLASLASDEQGNLYVVDSQARQLLVYPGAAEGLVDPPRVALDADASVPLEHALSLLPLDDFFVLLDDGRVARFDRQGQPRPFELNAPGGRVGPIASLAHDGSGGLYLADPEHERVVQTTVDGGFVRQLRGSSLAGLRALHPGMDYQYLYGLAADGIIDLALPMAP